MSMAAAVAFRVRFSARPWVGAAALIALLSLPVWSVASPRGTGGMASRPGGGPVDLGIVKGGARLVKTVAIPQWQPQGGSRTLPPNLVEGTIYRDLQMSGLFAQPPDARRVESAHSQWKTSGQRDVSPWRAMGVGFFVSTTYQVSASGQIVADAYIFEVASGKQIFGKKYTGFTADQAVRLAHRVADDIMQYVALEPGINNTLIAFVSNRTGAKELWVMDANGANARPLTNDKALVTTPTWGARGMELYYTSYKRYNPDLYGVSIDGGKRWPISTAPGNNISPDWNEARGLLTLVMGKDGNQEIYVVDRGGKSPRRLTNDKSIDGSPVWSPDGSKIAYVSNRTGGPQVYLMGADGRGAKRISFGSSYCTSPAWSPDGSRLAFVARMGGRNEIMVMDMRGGQARAVTSGPGNSEDPTWAANGQYIAYSNDRGGNFQIFRMRADGTQQMKLTSEGENISPVWSPMY